MAKAHMACKRCDIVSRALTLRGVTAVGCGLAPPVRGVRLRWFRKQGIPRLVVRSVPSRETGGSLQRGPPVSRVESRLSHRRKVQQTGRPGRVVDTPPAVAVAPCARTTDFWATLLRHVGARDLPDSLLRVARRVMEEDSTWSDIFRMI